MTAASPSPYLPDDLEKWADDLEPVSVLAIYREAAAIARALKAARERLKEVEMQVRLRNAAFDYEKARADAAEAKAGRLREALHKIAFMVIPHTPLQKTIADMKDIADAALSAEADQGEAVVAEELRIVFDGPPGPEAGRFVEVENADGRSINAGEWRQRADGLWELVLSPRRGRRVMASEIEALLDDVTGLTAAKAEGRLAGLREAAEIAQRTLPPPDWSETWKARFRLGVKRAAFAIEARAKEPASGTERDGCSHKRTRKSATTGALLCVDCGKVADLLKAEDERC
jgi:hypothetical protein